MRTSPVSVDSVATTIQSRYARRIGTFFVLLVLVFQSAVWAAQSCHQVRAAPDDMHSAHSHEAASHAGTDDHHGHAAGLADAPGQFHKCPVCAACCLSVAFSTDDAALLPLDYRSPSPGPEVMRTPPFPLYDPPFHPPRASSLA